MKSALIFLAILTICSVSATAQEPSDPLLFGYEIEKLLTLGSGLLSTGLFITAYIAYNRTKNRRLLFVSGAFFLFALKGFLLSMELVIGDVAMLDLVASILDFAILLCFFAGLLKK